MKKERMAQNGCRNIKNIEEKSEWHDKKCEGKTKGRLRQQLMKLLLIQDHLKAGAMTVLGVRSIVNYNNLLSDKQTLNEVSGGIR